MKPEEEVKLGMNRTGMAVHPVQSARLLEVEPNPPDPPGDARLAAAFRVTYEKAAGALGSVPPPPTLKGLAKAVIETMKGHKPSLFLDKLGERLAFERTGTRLYEGILAKLDGYGTYEGGPSRERLVEIHDQELEHMHLVRECIVKLGADPTVMTPSADIVGVQSLGLLQSVNDPRVPLKGALHAALVVELTDTANWELLVELATEFGLNDMANDFREALRTEAEHLVDVRRWVSRRVLGEARRELEPAPPPP